jgi:two-component system response regulator AtoC
MVSEIWDALLMSGGTVLLVDDDAAVRKVLASLLVQDGIEAVEADSGHAALRLLENHPIDVVVTDLRMPGMDGMELLGKMGASWPDVPVVILTAHGTVPLAVNAMKAGALEFLVKPFERDEVLFVVKKALAVARVERTSAPPVDGGVPLVGKSPAMKSLGESVRRAAAGVATVLIRGETGTGKELVARAIHELSARASKPFVKLNCAALPDSLLESELFGYEKGAFTGASARKPGRVELAHGGTLFLDEIGDVPLGTQVKLLRILQEREIERLGGTETIKIDVRFVAATHRNLELMVQDQEFREDLFYRLNVIPLEVPPLRQRPEDVEALVYHFVGQITQGPNPKADIARDAVELLAAQHWPGNVRQLENFIERLVVLSDGPLILKSDVDRELARDAAREPSVRSSPVPSAGASGLDQQRRAAEREAILEALSRAKNNRSLAARLLGVSRRTLYNKIEELGVG